MKKAKKETRDVYQQDPSSEANPDKDSLLSTLRPILPSWADPAKVSLKPLCHGGSVRKYYRIANGSHSIIVMDSSSLPEDFDSFISLADKLESSKVPIPKIHAVLPEKKIALMEDLGDVSLYSLTQNCESKEEVVPHYEEVIGHLLRMQRSEELSTVKREFDFCGLRWETEYFYLQFILRYCGMEVDKEERLFAEFDALATTLAKLPRVFMHRDFQSQNIMVGPKGVAFLDFQGGRRGIPHYDLASLLRDPYVKIPKETEKKLRELYLEKARGVPWLDENKFITHYNLASIQRHSQALGAFAYLSLELKKIHFIPHIAPCMEYLQRELAETDEFPCFREIVAEAALAYEKRKM